MGNTIFTFKKQLLFIVLLCAASWGFAQEKTIHVEVSGDVTNLLTATEKSSVVKLTVTTASGVKLNEADFTVMNAMPKLKELDLSGDLNTTDFPGNAFKDNATIEKIAFPANTAIFGGGAFTNCALKGVVSFPKSITNFAVFVSRFDNCQGITGFAFPDNDPAHVMQAVDGVIVAYGTNLMKYPCGRTDETYTVPDGITYIAQQAFGDNHRLKKLILSASVSSFQNESATFRNSTTLQTIEVVPENITFGSTANGFLFRKDTGSLFFLPPANKDENVVIDGTFVKIIGGNFFSNSPHVKSVVFGEGVQEIGYSCFKQGANGPLQLEYVELPSTLTLILGEAFANCGSLLQLVSKATTPPVLKGNAIFRGANAPNTIKIGVPESALADYMASSWIDANYSSWTSVDGELVETGTKGNGWSFTADQIVAYKNISYENASGSQSVSVPGCQVKVTAGQATGGEAFSGWESDPAGVVFMNANASTTYFTMPASDVTIKAIFKEAKPYTIIGATVSQSGLAGVGSIVNLETAGTRVVGGNTVYFQGWQINKGDGLVIDNPALAATSFVMIDGEVEIEALYATAYLININGGTAVLEAFEGDIVTITASKRPNMTFTNWTTTTTGVEFVDATAEVTTFVMPASIVDIKANFKNNDETGLDNQEGDQLLIYPNPATDYINLTNAPATGYQIYNVSGKVIAQGIANGQPIQISDLAAGVYVLKADGKSYRFIKK